MKKIHQEFSKSSSLHFSRKPELCLLNANEEIILNTKNEQQPGMKIITRAISLIECKHSPGIKLSNITGFQAAKRTEMI